MKKSIGEILEEIYDSALTQEPVGYFASIIARYLPDTTVALVGYDFSLENPIAFEVRNIESGLASDYLLHFQYINPWIRKFSEAPVGRRLVTEDVLLRDDLLKTRFYADFLRPAGNITEGTGAMLFKSASRSFGLAFNHPQLSEQETAALGRTADGLLPHLRRAIDIKSRLGQFIDLQCANEAVFSRLNGVLFLLEDDARVLFANARAETFLAAQGRDIRVVNQRLVFSDPRNTRRIQNALCCETTPGFAACADSPLVLELADGSRRTALLFRSHAHRRLRSVADDRDRSFIVLFISDGPPKTQVPAGVLKLLYDLSPAEANLAIALADGQSPKEYSAANNISINTVRNQIRAVMAKVGERRQAALVQRILRDAGLHLQASGR